MRLCYNTDSSYCSGLSLGLLCLRPVLRCYPTGTITTVKDCTELALCTSLQIVNAYTNTVRQDKLMTYPVKILFV